MRWWWKNEGGKLHDILKMCDRKELEQWSGRIPLLLRFAADIDILDVYKNVRTSSTDLSRSPPTSHVELMQALDAQNYPLFLTAWYNALWCCEGIKKIQWQITTFIADTLKACNNDLERKK